MTRFLLALFLFVTAPLYAQQSVVEKYRPQYPTPMSADQKVDLLRHVAVDVHGGLLVKPDGSNCNGYACDIICFSDAVLFDVLHAEGETADPTWNPAANPRNYHCELVATTPQPAPVPPPVVIPLSAPAFDVAAAVAQIRQDVADLRDQEEKHWQNAKNLWQQIWSFIKSPAMWTAVGGVITGLKLGK